MQGHHHFLFPSVLSIYKAPYFLFKNNEKYNPQKFLSVRKYSYKQLEMNKHLLTSCRSIYRLLSQHGFSDFLPLFRFLHPVLLVVFMLIFIFHFSSKCSIYFQYFLGTHFSAIQPDPINLPLPQCSRF